MTQQPHPPGYLGPRRRERPEHLRSVLWMVLRAVNLFLLFVISAGVGVFLGSYTGISSMVPDIAKMGEIQPGSGSRIVSADGQVLATLTTQNREFVSVEKIPRQLQEAVIATEDRDFYRHIGVDPRGIMRALYHDLRAGGVRQGGSTITQQLAGTVYLDRRQRTFSRKLAEMVLAVQLERAYTKPEIMELYLNQIYFGEGAYGVQVASKTYFSKDVSKLGLGEVALLAGVIRRPEGYSPFEDEQRAIDRRDRVLSLMREEGYITAEEAEQAKATRLVFNPNRKPLARGGYTSPWFVSYVIKQFVEQYGADALYKGQFTIHTTLNPDMQKAAEEAVRDGLRRNRRQRVSQMALVAVDVHTGAIKAMVGGADFNKNQYNVAAQGIGRQAGSAFKPFVYTAALLQGDTPQTKVNDSTVTYPAGNGKKWIPHNYETGRTHGIVTYRNALAHSFNISAVRVADRVGIDSVIEVAAKLGIPENKMQPYLSTALGTASVTPLEMASAFAVFSTGGMRTEPYAIQKIVDARGRTVDERQPVTWRVLDEGVAYTMVDMLEDVIKYGTAGRIRHRLSFHAAGKTGTSSSYRDAWFVGFTDDLSAAVWSGNLHSEPTARGAGGTVSAPVWADFMVKAEPIMVAARNAGQEERAQEITPPKVRKPRPAAADATDPAADGDEVVTPPDGEASPEAPAAEDGSDAQTGDAGDQADRGGVVYKRICSASGLLAGHNCPASEVNEVGYDARHGGRPPTRVCDAHTGRAARTTETRTSGRPETRAVGKVTVSVCAITKKLATPYCPVVQNITLDADRIPTETCTRHARR